MLGPWARFKKRLAGCVVLTIYSITSLVLLPNSGVSTHLQNNNLGTAAGGELWRWDLYGEEDDLREADGKGLRLVVFGDSWADDTIETDQEGKGKSWTEVMCSELNCTSYLNLAASQPSSAYPSLAPTGAFTSNAIHAHAVQNTRFLPSETTAYALPDLTTQISQFLALPAPEKAPEETLFVLSFGFWDIYDFARLDYKMGINATDRSVEHIFAQLEILYSHFAETLYPARSSSANDKTATPAAGVDQRPRFRVVIPKIFDPTLTPGWLSHRPAPQSPSSVVEQQKNAVYLTERWNQRMENAMGGWVDDVSGGGEEHEDKEEKVVAVALQPPALSKPAAAVTVQSEGVRKFAQGLGRNFRVVGVSRPRVSAAPAQPANFAGMGPASDDSEKEEEVKEEVNDEEDLEKKEGKEEEEVDLDEVSVQAETGPPRAIFHHDLPTHLLTPLLEHQLYAAGLSDASALGQGPPLFDSVSVPCVHERLQSGDGKGEGDGSSGPMMDVRGWLFCVRPARFLWWDAFGVGEVVGERIGKEVAERFRGGGKGWRKGSE